MGCRSCYMQSISIFPKISDREKHHFSVQNRAPQIDHDKSIAAFRSY